MTPSPRNGGTARRQWHSKVRSGCLTCKARKIRCDEAKPHCNRCSSTGRTCAGYESRFIDMSASKVSSASADLSEAADSILHRNPKLLVPRFSEKELHSFRFFLERTAPAFAGVFHIDFWLQEVPRACHVDTALWHAACCLGAVDESYNMKGGKVPTYITSDKQVQFALQQYSYSIKSLVNSSRCPPDKFDKQIALAASILFTCTCSIQGLQDQALIHLRGGLKLLEEIREEDLQPASLQLRTTLCSSPLTLVTTQSVLSSLNIQAEALVGEGINYESPSLVGVDCYSSWRLYRAPSLSSESTPASLKNLLEACRAIESLFNSMIAFLRTPHIYHAVISGNFSTVIQQQLPFARTLQNLTSALETFEAFSLWTSDRSKQKAITVLKMFHMVCRYMLLPKIMPAERLDQFDSILRQIVDFSEDILSEDSNNGLVSRQEDMLSSITAPKPSVTQLLFVAACSSRSTLVRARAIELLGKYPRREGLWDSPMSATLARHMLQANGLPTTVEEEQAMFFDKSKIDRLWTSYAVTVVFKGERRAQMTMRTFEQWQTGARGRQRFIEW